MICLMGKGGSNGVMEPNIKEILRMGRKMGKVYLNSGLMDLLTMGILKKTNFRGRDN